MNMWFDQGSTDASGTADMASRATRYLTWWMGRIENSLTGKNGAAVGDSLSLADVLMYNTFAEHMKDSECAADFAAWKKGAFGDKVRFIREKKMIAKEEKGTCQYIQ